MVTILIASSGHKTSISQSISTPDGIMSMPEGQGSNAVRSMKGISPKSCFTGKAVESYFEFFVLPCFQNRTEQNFVFYLLRYFSYKCLFFFLFFFFQRPKAVFMTINLKPPCKLFGFYVVLTYGPIREKSQKFLSLLF